MSPTATARRKATSPCPWSALILHSANFPHLTHLRLRVSSTGDAGCQEIVRPGILGRLQVLDLRPGCVTEQGARTLAAGPGVYWSPQNHVPYLHEGEFE